MKTVKLGDGTEAHAALVALVHATLVAMLEKADRAAGDAMSGGVSYLLALYDLAQLVDDPDYHPNCFGPNRQKLLDARLVEGGETGPLRVVAADIVRNALVVDGTNIIVRSPVAAAAAVGGV